MVPKSRTSLISSRKGVVSHIAIGCNYGQQKTRNSFKTTHDTNKAILQISFEEKWKTLKLM